MSTLANTLDEMTAEGELYEKLDQGEVRCYACAHRCLIREGRRGVCQVRFNRQGRLYAPWGYVAGLHLDPIEKKPFFHILPGEGALTFGMLGCDFHCDFCQNYVSSQALRDPMGYDLESLVRRISPEQIVGVALRNGASIVASSYNEPLITTEWAVGVFKQARQAGLKCVFVSNGNATPEVLEYLRPYLDGYKIDLKSMQDRQYRRMGGVLANVLDTIRRAHELGFWVEVVTLVVPGMNDSPDELMEMARFLVSVSPDIPWHVTAFHPDYKMNDRPPTPVRTLVQAAEIGQEAGLRHVYAGNLPGRVGEYESTYCPKCGTAVIERYQYTIRSYRLSAGGRCPKCGAGIAGMWRQQPGTGAAGN